MPPLGIYARFGKRLLDVALAVTLLLLSLPLQALLAVVLAAHFRGNPLFCQTRVGWRERPFRLAKFRSMRRGTEPDARRLTPLGHWLRRTSLDELPQLWHVLLGQMSLVGPRPLLPQYRALYSARQRLRHHVRPGITGLAQVSGRNALGWYARLHADEQYAATLSLAADLRILRRSFTAVWSGLRHRHGISHPHSDTMPYFRGNTGEQFVVYGAGGHGQVLAETLAAQGHTLVGVFDDQPLPASHPLHALALGTYRPATHPQALIVVALGENRLRRDIAARVLHLPGVAVHPDATVAPSAMLADGVQVLARAVVHTQAQVGAHSIVNTGAVVEHHAQVGAFCHLYHNSVVCGGAVLEDEVQLGPGAVVWKQVRVGAGSHIGPNAVVTADVPPGSRIA